jgi:DNA-binding Xre family transcriptional regulator
VVIAIIDFSPLWDTMEQKKISQYYLLKQGIDNKTLDSLKKNKNITLNTLEKLCQILDCEDLNKIVKFID